AAGRMTVRPPGAPHEARTGAARPATSTAEAVMMASSPRPEIFIGLGANLPSPRHGTPRAACETALRLVAEAGVRVVRRSRWYESAPVPPSDQPWYVNGVAEVETALDPSGLLLVLKSVESRMERDRAARNAPRIIDLDLLAYGEMVADGAGGGPILPHPRLSERAFVLLPLRELAPAWRHPATGWPLDRLIGALPPGQVLRPLAG
ncbi:MAG: 2-amino-4-hydroxy-6-hydroxymethyldihydropteridine diphosphokinase, partial [Alphaproteobacteria bacterium]